jgi:hypothetical protein
MNPLTKVTVVPVPSTVQEAVKLVKLVLDPSTGFVIAKVGFTKSTVKSTVFVPFWYATAVLFQ